MPVDELRNLPGKVVGRRPAELGGDDYLVTPAAYLDEPYPTGRTCGSLLRQRQADRAVRLLENGQPGRRLQEGLTDELVDLCAIIVISILPAGSGLVVERPGSLRAPRAATYGRRRTSRRSGGCLRQ